MIHKQIYLYLQQVAQEQRTVPYIEIAQMAGLNMSRDEDRGRLGYILGDISTYEHEHGRPMLSVVTVFSNEGYPSEGFFKLARELGRYRGKNQMDELEFFAKELKAAHTYWKDRPALPPPDETISPEPTQTVTSEVSAYISSSLPVQPPVLLKVYQGSGAEDCKSPAERLMLALFEKLPEPYTIIHSAKWISVTSEGAPVGEADFVIAHPDFGVLVMEIKGGQIRVERNQWTSLSQSGTEYAIKDPFAQSDRSKYALMDWLKTDGRTRRYNYPVFTAVAFPDVGVYTDIRPDCPKEIVIDATRADRLERTLKEIYGYWRKRYSHLQMSGGQASVAALVDLLVPTRTLQTRVAEIFERERRKIDELTHRQYNVLRLLRHYRRAAIVGGAGTGKTMLAMEKAQQLANDGRRVLFLCFNRNLAAWLEKNLADTNIHVSTYHSFVGTAREWARISYGAHMGMEEFREKAPDILMDAASVIRSPNSDANDRLFDAIIVDEAQDFEDHWWIPLPEFLKDPIEGTLYVFFDNNQRIYTQIANVPIDVAPFPLDENCRNTQQIYGALLPYAVTSAEASCIGPEGRPVERIPVASAEEARTRLQRVLHKLVNEDGLRTNAIIVLTPVSEKRSQWKSDDMLGNFVLTWDMDTQMRDAIRICTIHSFKGLESPVVILTEMNEARSDISDQLVYIGLSRARNHVMVIGDLPEPATEV
jgi:hypothetical protein